MHWNSKTINFVVWRRARASCLPRRTEHWGGRDVGAFDLPGQMLCDLSLFGTRQGVTRCQKVETHPDTRFLPLAGTLVTVADPDDHAQPLDERPVFRTTEIQLEFRQPSAEG